MSDSKYDDVSFSFKVVINKERTRVLFADIGNDFADVLLSFLTLPLGTVVKVIENHFGDDEAPPVFGSITTLYNGLSNLDRAHFRSEEGKQMLLDPVRSSGATCRKLKIDLGNSHPIKYFRCKSWECDYPKEQNIGVHFSTAKCQCGETLNEEISVPRCYEEAYFIDDGIVFTLPTTFILSDDLQILPNETMGPRREM